jgi:ABC-type multidrug transport system ATPase subunit
MQVLWGQIAPVVWNNFIFTSPGRTFRLRKSSVQVVVAAPYMDLIEELTLTEHLAFHFKLRKPRPGYSVDSILEKLYMTDSRDKQIANFSSGMKQRAKAWAGFFYRRSR